MDILTPRGQVALGDEQHLARWLEERFAMKYIQTPKNSPAIVDAIVTNKSSSEILAVVETKCRYDINLEQFQTNYKNEWLVTWSKVSKAMNIAVSLGVPFVGFLYLTKCNTALMQRISEADGKLVSEIRLSTTETQATTNGGRAIRTNAFIDMSKANIYNLE